ncbi:MAG: protease family protein [Actinomycetota bacterium]|nr:protease family protein [Actinomycetota bacterium]
MAWTGRDLAITLLAGGGLGLFLTVLFLLPLQNAGTQLRPAAVLLITSLLVYGPLCLLGWYFALKRNGASPADAGLRWVGWGPVLLMIPGAIGLIIVTGLLSALISQLLGDVPTAQEQVIPGQSTLPTWDLVALVVAGAVAAPFAEEFLFRGLLYRYLRSRRSVQTAVLISSLIFAIAHFTPILIPVLFVFGIAEALVAERYESLYPAMALHALNNGALFVALYLTLN